MNERGASHILALYHESDDQLFKQLKIYLAPLRRTGQLDVTKLDLPAGLDEAEQQRWIDGIDLVVVFLTPLFIAEFDQLLAIPYAIQRWKEKKLLLLPVLAQQVRLDGTPFAGIRCLPSTGKPLAHWKDADVAWNDVIEGIAHALSTVRLPKSAAPERSAAPKPERQSGEVVVTSHPKSPPESRVAGPEAPVFRSGFGLFIGVGGNLPVTVQDATALAELFTDPSRAAYPKDQVTLLTESRAGRDAVLSALDDLIARTSAISEGATIVFYYSGHGARVRRQEKDFYYLVPSGYDPGRLADTAISGQELSDRLGQLMRHKLLVLLDCCHAGAIPMAKSEDMQISKSAIPHELIERLRDGTGQIIIASSMDHEISLTGQPYSIFTSCLLEALGGRGARNPEDGYAKIFDVAAYLLETVSPRARGIQHPIIKKMDNVTENFAICAYAQGGGRPAEPPSAGGRVAAKAALNHIEVFAQQRKDKELQSCMKEWELLTDKITQFRREREITASVPAQFELDYRITDLAKRLDEVNQRLARLSAPA